MASFDTEYDPVQRSGMDWANAGIDDSTADPLAAAIPGSGGVPAFTTTGTSLPPVPVLIAVPHAGRCYTDRLSAQLRHSPRSLRRLEDRLVDRVAQAVAQNTGAALLIAHAPRAMIDLNRSIEDMDWEMIESSPSLPGFRPSRRARSGLGLIPRRLPGLGELWKGRLPRSEFENRVAAVHASYHDHLEVLLRRISEQWGAALLIDLHSMPPLRREAASEPAIHFVIGDRFGTSCSPGLTSAAFDYFACAGQGVAYNRPYAGGYVLERHGGVHRVHALQIEVCRSLYLDSRLDELSSGFDSLAATLSGLVARLAEDVADLGRASLMPQAAE